MSNARRHFSRWRTWSGTPALARRSRTASARCGLLVVVSSQDAGQNSRQFAATDAASLTTCTLTAIWQLAVLPNVPEYWRATHGDAVPSLGKPVSSITYASGPIAPTAQRATFARTCSYSHVEEVMNCCNRW